MKEAIRSHKCPFMAVSGKNSRCVERLQIKKQTGGGR